MEKLPYRVINIAGNEVGSVELNPDVFGCDVDPSVVHRVVVWQLNKRRAGTHSAKTRAEVSGGGRKPWKQKGRGTARSGSNTSPVWVRGGVAHGPKPRSYETRLNKSTRRRALAGVLSDKVRNGSLILIDQLTVEGGRTKEFNKILKNVNAEEAAIRGGILVVLPQKEDFVWRSTQNIQKVDALPVAGLNVYDLLRHKILISTPEALKSIEQRVLAVHE